MRGEARIGLTLQLRVISLPRINCKNSGTEMEFIIIFSLPAGAVIAIMNENDFTKAECVLQR